MYIIANLLVLLVAMFHVFIMVLETFLWQTDFGLKTFNMSPEMAATTATLAANQGIYNGLLAGGLFWSVIAEREGFALKVFFLVCVILAGIMGGLTAKFSILYTQAAPAAVALLAVLAARGRG